MKKLLLSVLLLAGAIVGLTELFPERVADLGMGLERAAAGMDYRTVQVDGETWHYLEAGPSDAEAVLAIHGFGSSKDNWSRFAKFVNGRYRFIVPDLPGFGQSARHPDWDYSPLAQRDRLRGFVEAKGLETFHLVGLSMGGHIAALYAHAYPEQVTTLALFDNAGVIPPVESDLLRAIEAGSNPLVVENRGDFDRLLDFAFHEEPFMPWPFRRAYGWRAAEQGAFNQLIFGQLRDASGSFVAPLDPLLPEIRQPVLILWGEEDRVIDKSAIDVMRPLLRDPEVVILEDTGHVPILERPEETARHYLEFIGKY